MRLTFANITFEYGTPTMEFRRIPLQFQLMWNRLLKNHKGGVVEYIKKGARAPFFMGIILFEGQFLI